MGLIVQGIASYHMSGSIWPALWAMLAYFTILTNLLVAIVFSGIAWRRTVWRSESIVGGTMLAILLVGVVYALLLHGTTEFSGGSAVANVLLHMVTPVLVPLYWIAWTRKGTLTWRHPLAWAVYPLVYLAYALVRGGLTGRYAYPFLDVPVIGWGQTVTNAACIAAGFLLCGFLVLWIDSLAERMSRTPR